MQFNIDDIRRVRKNREDTRVDIYNEIITQCLKKIKFINKNSNEVSFCYKIPYMIPGKPIFNYETCVVYIKTKLKDLGFLVKRIDTETLYISWEKIHLSGENKGSSEGSSSNNGNGSNRVSIQRPSVNPSSVLRGLEFNIKPK